MRALTAAYLEKSFDGRTGRYLGYVFMNIETPVGQLPQDLILLGNILKICDLDTIVLGVPERKSVLHSETFGDTTVCGIASGFPFRGQFSVPPDWCLIGCVHETQKSVACNGVPLEPGMAFTVLPHGVSEWVFGSGSRVTLLLLPLERLQQMAAGMEAIDRELQGRVLSLFNTKGTPVGLALRAQFETISQRLTEQNRSQGADVSIRNELDLLLKNHLLVGHTAQPSDRPQCTRGRRVHYSIVQRAELFMRENMQRVIYLEEICGAAGVSERALRYAFEAMFAVSPNRYLSLLRLCSAFRLLAAADASRRSVKSVALSCGLWDLSRFAEHYRNLFGELPRDTLARKPPVFVGSLSELRETA